MEDGLYHRHLEAKHALQIKLLGSDEREFTHKTIYDVLGHGLLREETRAGFRGILLKLAQEGAEGIIRGCTELGLLLKPDEAPGPLLSTQLELAAHVRLLTTRSFHLFFQELEKLENSCLFCLHLPLGCAQEQSRACESLAFPAQAQPACARIRL